MNDIAVQEYRVTWRIHVEYTLNTCIGPILCKYMQDTRKYAYREQTPPKVRANPSSTPAHPWID